MPMSHLIYNYPCGKLLTKLIMADTLQTQVERDILPWVLSIKRVADWGVQPALKTYRLFDFIAQVALVLGSIGISSPALNAIGSVVSEKPTAAANATAANVPPSGTNQPPKNNSDDWVEWMKQFAAGKHPGIAIVLILGWAVPKVYFKRNKFAERSVLVDSLQEEGRKLEKELLDALGARNAAPGLLQGIQEKVNNLVDAHIGPRSYPIPTPLEGTEAEATKQVVAWVTKFPDVPWKREFKEGPITT